ncbi:hypothetical protein Q6346_11495 [Isoptericola sp. b490]|uniref:hypothetical protein n=1 Tax=Actinotalea lenta TaxID=3064654 RepID=UPI0027131D8D|nr:hypothetical protein [Isoptericola sp. b490]MDO8121934.1 hypothetical protein [Isoptericola sp. b490]
MAVAVLTLAALAVLVPAALGLAVRVPATDRDTAWLAGGTLPAAEQVRDVYRRYLVRHRSYRLAAAWFGALLAVVVGVTAEGGVHAGIGRGSPLADVWFCAVAGILLGALLAESYRLSQPRGTVATASLAPRPAPGETGRVVAARVLAAASLATGAGVLAAAGDATSLAVAVGGSALVGVAELTRSAIRSRRRPVMSEQAGEVDVRLRSYAWRAVAHLELAAAALALGWAVSKTPSPGGPLTTVVVLVLLVLAVVELHRARPRPPRSFVPVQEPAVP